VVKTVPPSGGVDGPRRSGELRRLGDILGPALDHLAGSDQARAYGAWARAAGEQVSGGARPRAFARGTLTVECSSSVWANELTYLSADVLRRMDAVAPGHPVKKLRFMVVTTPRAQEPETSTSKIVQRHARPARPDYGDARTHAEGVRDERLRAAIEALLEGSCEGSARTPEDRTPGG
jgi:hypothetical protein